MYITKQKSDLIQLLTGYKNEGDSIGFVPTMGALHAGHISLIEEAEKKNAKVVASVFVNPTQFNDPKDFEKYPITIEKDIQMLAKAGCDMLFLPSVSEMYPEGLSDLETYDFGFLETVLDGAARPGHFQGVGQVVSRLMEIVQPDDLYLGQKDFQQCLIISELVKQKGYKAQLNYVPTKREPDGLAMSSRNKRLTDKQRATASLIYQCLISIEAQNGQKPFSIVQKECQDIMMDKGLRPDYIMLANAETLELLEDYDASKKMVALLAAYAGDVRLIDNLILKK